MRAWLDGLDVIAEGAVGGPAHHAAAALIALGATARYAPSKSEMLTGGGHSTTVPDWVGERAARSDIGLPSVPPHPLIAVYLGLRAAAAMLAGQRLMPMKIAAELTVGLSTGSHPELLRGSDGWLVARWRSAAERALLASLGDRRRVGIEAISAWASELRLLVAPVRRFPRPASPLSLSPGYGALDAQSAISVVDWSSLWAGPWAAGRLAAEGANVDRIEHPVRRDGYSPRSAAYRRFNHGKRLHLLDLGTAEGHARATRLLEEADVVISGHTPRVLPSFGFNADWLAARGPRLLVELVAYEPPRHDHPGLGEQGSAVAGLLWRRGRPYPPIPWADPLLGAQTLLAVQAWKTAGRPRGARVRLSLEGAASLAARARAAA
jgi:hypothetical protein